MIFVSDKGILEGVRGEQLLYTPKGDVYGKDRALMAQFERGGAPQWVLDFAFERLEFRGIPDGITREQRCFVFDSQMAQQANGWSDEEREIVENYLLGRIAQGANDYVIAEQPKLTAPWPKYDELKAIGRRTVEMVAEQIADRVRDLGIDPGYVVRYEQENENRPEVIEAMKKVAAEPAADVIEVPA